MAVPSDAVLRAAMRWVEQFSLGVARSRTFFTTLPQYADLSPSQYDAGLEWLRRNDMYQPINPKTNERLFAGAIRDAGWFEDADALVESPEEIPQDAERAARVFSLDRDEAYLQLQIAWGKFDASMRKEVGDLGERLLVERLKSEGVHRVEHVSLVSDGYGFDVLAERGDQTFLLEVKATTRRNRAVAFLSRHEFDVMRRDLRWRMVFVVVDIRQSVLTRISSVPSTWISEQAPRDRGRHAMWQSVRLDTAGAPNVDGIPELGVRPALS